MINDEPRPDRATLEHAAAMLDADPGYRVLRALPPLSTLPLAAPRGRVRQALVLDIETTSLDWRCGHIIEFAACLVGFDSYGSIVSIGRTVDWLEEPPEPLTGEISRLTKLTDADLHGHRIDDGAVERLLLDADLRVAANCQFDVAWIEDRYPATAGMNWACSMREIDWAAQGCTTRNLGSLLQERCGWFNARHRADSDVEALVALLASPLDDGRPAFAEMLMTAATTTLRVSATAAPYEHKDALKARRYRWNADKRVWQIEIAEAALDAELSWLRTTAGCTSPGVTPITWFERHR